MEPVVVNPRHALEDRVDDGEALLQVRDGAEQRGHDPRERDDRHRLGAPHVLGLHAVAHDVRTDREGQQRGGGERRGFDVAAVPDVDGGGDEQQQRERPEDEPQDVDDVRRFHRSSAWRTSLDAFGPADDDAVVAGADERGATGHERLVATHQRGDDRVLRHDQLLHRGRREAVRQRDLQHLARTLAERREQVDLLVADGVQHGLGRRAARRQRHVDADALEDAPVRRRRHARDDLRDAKLPPQQRREQVLLVAVGHRDESAGVAHLLRLEQVDVAAVAVQHERALENLRDLAAPVEVVFDELHPRRRVELHRPREAQPDRAAADDHHLAAPLVRQVLGDEPRQLVHRLRAPHEVDAVAIGENALAARHEPLVAARDRDDEDAGRQRPDLHQRPVHDGQLPAQAVLEEADLPARELADVRRAGHGQDLLDLVGEHARWPDNAVDTELGRRADGRAVPSPNVRTYSSFDTKQTVCLVPSLRAVRHARMFCSSEREHAIRCSARSAPARASASALLRSLRAARRRASRVRRAPPRHRGRRLRHGHGWSSAASPRAAFPLETMTMSMLGAKYQLGATH